MNETACQHVFDSNGFAGVIIGVSTCLKCGATSRMSDFPHLASLKRKRVAMIRDRQTLPTVGDEPKGTKE